MLETSSSSRHSRKDTNRSQSIQFQWEKELRRNGKTSNETRVAWQTRISIKAHDWVHLSSNRLRATAETSHPTCQRHVKTDWRALWELRSEKRFKRVIKHLFNKLFFMVRRSAGRRGRWADWMRPKGESIWIREEGWIEEYFWCYHERERSLDWTGYNGIGTEIRHLMRITNFYGPQQKSFSLLKHRNISVRSHKISVSPPNRWHSNGINNSSSVWSSLCSCRRKVLNKLIL